MLGGCGLLIVIILALGWCASNNEPATPNADEISFIDMPGLANYAMYIPAGTDPDKLVDSAKSKCGTQEICSVFGWIDRNDMARMLPMTDREVETQTFKYGVNRTTGFEQRLWDCRLYPGKKGDECL